MEKQSRPQTIDLLEKPSDAKGLINNDFYEELLERWYTADDHPIALLRAENAVRIPWIINQIGPKKTVLDIGCGAGLLTNALAEAGHKVYGIDLSASSLAVAKKHDRTRQVCYERANAYSLPYSDQSFEIVCAMDLLEHVENPGRVIQEASRVLKPNGLFFFHTFNRNLLSYLIVIKGVEWFVPNAPKNMHVYPLFIKPKELKQLLLQNNLNPENFQGFAPRIFSKEFWQMAIKKKVPSNLCFHFTKSLATGYCGWAKKIYFNIRSAT